MRINPRRAPHPDAKDAEFYTRNVDWPLAQKYVVEQINATHAKYLTLWEKPAKNFVRLAFKKNLKAGDGVSAIPNFGTEKRVKRFDSFYLCF